MTFERKIILGLDDIKSITFECVSCKARMTIPAGALRDVPKSCGFCNVRWSMQAEISVNAESASTALIQAIVTMRILIREKTGTFRILLEFDEPTEN